jgi:hypothetical protein
MKPNVELIPTPRLMMAKLNVIIVHDRVIPPMLGGEATTGTVCSRRWNQPIARIVDATRRD